MMTTTTARKRRRRDDGNDDNDDDGGEEEEEEETTTRFLRKRQRRRVSFDVTQREGNNDDDDDDDDDSVKTNVRRKTTNENSSSSSLIARIERRCSEIVEKWENYDEADDFVERYKLLNDALTFEVSRALDVADDNVGNGGGGSASSPFRQEQTSQQFEDLLVRLFRRAFFLSSTSHEFSENTEESKQVLALLTEDCSRAKLSVSPWLTFDASFGRDDRGDRRVRDLCSVGWMVDDDALVSAKNPERSKFPNEEFVNRTPTLAALVAETTVREARVDDVERMVVVDSNSDIRRQIQNPTLRTTLFCEYDLFACNVAREFARLRRIALARFERDLTRRSALAIERERESLVTLERERKALADFSEKRENEIRATNEAIELSNELSDRNAALTLTLANLDTELRTQELLVLESAEEEVRRKLTSNPDVLRMRDNVVRMQREGVEIVDETRTRAEAISKRLSKIIDAAVATTTTTTTTTTTDGSLNEFSAIDEPEETTTVVDSVLRVGERIVAAAATCESSGALILLANNVDEIAAIARECEPLRNLSATKHLFDARSEYRAERDRRERLERVFRTRAGRVRDYSIRMYDYLNWLRCFDLANARGNAVCTDDDSRRAYRSDFSKNDTTTPILHGIPAINVDFMQKMTRFVYSERRPFDRGGENVRASMLTHALISDMFDCPLPKTNVFADIGKEFYRATTPKYVTDAVSQRLFRWPVGIPEPEKRGLAFAVLAATCPRQ